MFAKAIKQEKTIRLVKTGKGKANFVDNVIVYLEKTKESMQK